MKKYSITAILLALGTWLSCTACAGGASRSEQSAGSIASEESAALPENSPDSQPQTADSAAPAPESSTPEKPQHTETTAPPQASEPQQTAHTTVTLPAGEKRELLHPMRCLKNTEEISAICPAGGAKAAVTARDGKCCIVDLAEDKITAEFRLNTAWERVIGVSGSTVITSLTDMENNSIIYYDTAAGTSETVSNFGGNSFSYGYDAAAGTVYGLGSYSVSTLLRRGGETPVYLLPESDRLDDSVRDLYLQSGLFTVNKPDAGAFSGRSMAFLSLRDQREQFRIADFLSRFGAAQSGIVRVDAVYSPSKQTDMRNCTVFDAKNGSRLRSFALPDGFTGDLFTAPESRFFLLFSCSKEDRPADSAVLCDAETGKTEKLNIGFSGERTGTACYIPDLGCWVYAASEQKNGKTTSSLLRIDPSQAAFGTAAKAPNPISEDAKTGAEYADIRRRADAIEQKYGIRLLFGNEVHMMAAAGSWLMASTEDKNDPSYFKDYISTVSVAADTLETELARYPEGFFDIFRKNGSSGLRIAVPLRFLSKDPSVVTPAGVAFRENGRYNVVIECCDLNPQSKTLHHEMLHAVEQAMEAAGCFFDADEWNALNPAGFQYSDAPYTMPEDKLALDSSEDYGNVYLARGYGRNSQLEDRATIVEFCFSRCLTGESGKGISGYEFIRQSCPHLKAKLAYIEQQLKACWGYSYLEKIAQAGRLIG